MKEENGTIMMAGEKMNFVIDSVCVLSCKPEVAAKLPVITQRLRSILPGRDVARHFINCVRIGDTVALVDQKSGYTIRLQVLAHTIRMVGIHEKTPRHAEQKVVVLINDSFLWAVGGRKAAA